MAHGRKGTGTKSTRCRTALGQNLPKMQLGNLASGHRNYRGGGGGLKERKGARPNLDQAREGMNEGEERVDESDVV
jgi:hypothetical protein